MKIQYDWLTGGRLPTDMGYRFYVDSVKNLNNRLIVAIRPGFRPSDIPNWILARVQFANIPRIEISSTQIRQRWLQDKTIRYMVTQPV